MTTKTTYIKRIYDTLGIRPPKGEPYSLGVACTSQKINKWSKCKPIPSNKDYFESYEDYQHEAQKIDINYGFALAKVWSGVSFEDLLRKLAIVDYQWEHITNDGFVHRSSDFMYYLHSARTIGNIISLRENTLLLGENEEIHIQDTQSLKMGDFVGFLQGQTWRYGVGYSDGMDESTQGAKRYLKVGAQVVSDMGADLTLSIPYHETGTYERVAFITTLDEGEYTESVPLGAEFIFLPNSYCKVDVRTQMGVFVQDLQAQGLGDSVPIRLNGLHVDFTLKNDTGKEQRVYPSLLVRRLGSTISRTHYLGTNNNFAQSIVIQDLATYTNYIEYTTLEDFNPREYEACMWLKWDGNSVYVDMVSGEISNNSDDVYQLMSNFVA